MILAFPRKEMEIDIVQHGEDGVFSHCSFRKHFSCDSRSTGRPNISTSEGDIWCWGHFWKDDTTSLRRQRVELCLGMVANVFFFTVITGFAAL